MSQEDDLLDNLLSAASEELEALNKKEVLRDADLFQNKNNTVKRGYAEASSCSLIHNGDTDSSDEEGNRNFENAKYSECGKQIKQLMKNKSPPQTVSSSSICDKQTSSSWKSKALFAPAKKATPEKSNNEKNTFTNDVYTDPIFGLRIVNPLISSTVLKERMVGREAVPFSNISRYLQVYGKEKDWVIAGVIANKSVKTSQKGSQFSIWSLTDLKNDIKTVSLFLFSGAHKQLWKTGAGTVVGILNPNVLDKKDGSKDEATLSVDNAQKVMIFGQSKDFGTCKSVKKNGENCTAIVNISRCEYCIYHIKQEYQKCSKRSELQANFAGRGLTALRNKVLGKNEVFYAGKSYTAIPAKRSKKLEQRDNNRLKSLNDKGITVCASNTTKLKNKNPAIRKQNASRLEVSQAQRLRDIELLKKLGGSEGMESKNSFTGIHSTEVTLKDSRSNALDVINKLKEKCVESASSGEQSEYNLKRNDKPSFQEGLSETITLDEAKATALDVITKLKSKSNIKKNSNTSIKNDNNLNTNSTCDIFDDDMNLDYDDIDLSLGNKCNKSLSSNNSQTNATKLDTTNSLCDKNVSPSVSRNTSSKLQEGISKEKSAFNKENSKIITNEHKTTVTNVKFGKDYQSSLPLGFPKLSGGESQMIDLSKPLTPRRNMNKAKLNAIKMIQKNGPIKKADPNSVKGSGRKRPVEEPDLHENMAKKSKLADSEFISDRFKKMMAATSKHLDLLESRDDEEKEKYFTKMERKEQMEEKMATTFKIACKAVKCLQCKYTSFSASDLCKTEKHPLKVFDAMKRFFKCGNCGNRIVSLDIVPTGLCKNCGSGKWEKTGMMKEKVCGVTHSLSIRGGEQKFVNSVITNSDINLLVPEDE